MPKRAKRPKRAYKPNPAQGLRMIAARTGKPLSREWSRHISEGLMKNRKHRASRAAFAKQLSDRRIGKSLLELEGHKPHLYADERCEICERPNSAPFRRMHRDHDHTTRNGAGYCVSHAISRWGTFMMIPPYSGRRSLI